jgi:hypothetical protein
MGLPDPRESEGRRQGRLVQILPLLPRPLPLPHPPLLHLSNIVRHSVRQNSTGRRTFFWLKLSPQIFIDRLSHL